ncbi:MAG: hypothetical protein JWS12_702 [Candidatus Saccharibacteria bacterium]|nr:hypothetical protein [Candidatus Saccharibacteria bacterium]
MRTRSSQTGFSSVEIILVLVIMTIIGFVGWFVIQARNSTNTSLNSAASNNLAVGGSAKKATVTKAGELKEYKNDEHGFSFSYPANWAISENLSDQGRGGTEGDVVVTSPAGTKVHFGPDFGGKGGDCASGENGAHTTQTCSTLQTLTSEKLPNSSTTKPVYFYTASLTASLSNGGATKYFIDISNNIDGSAIKTGTFIGAVIYPWDEINCEKNGNLTVYVEGKDDTQNVTRKFFDSAEVKEATPVLKSIKLFSS